MSNILPKSSHVRKNNNNKQTKPKKPPLVGAFLCTATIEPQ